MQADAEAIAARGVLSSRRARESIVYHGRMGGERWQARPNGRVRARAIAVAILLWAPTAALPGADQPPAPADALSEARLLSAALGSVTGLVASFTQTVESAALPSPQVERGTVYLLRPGRMRFEYEEPKGKLAIADGRRTYLYLPEEHQALVGPLDAQGTRNGVSLLLRDRIDIVGEFAISWGEPVDRGAPRPLMLTPRLPNVEYRSLLIETGPEHLIRTLAVVDPLGNRVTYRFSRLKQTASLDPSLFRFTPPEGVELRDAGS